MKYWSVAGQHLGKKISELPITYLLWFVGSHQMRRSYWENCQFALRELERRLSRGTTLVEEELIRDLQPRTKEQKEAIQLRAENYRRTREKLKISSY